MERLLRVYWDLPMQVKTFECQQVQAGKESTSKQLKEARLLADTLQKKVSSIQNEIDNFIIIIQSIAFSILLGFAVLQEGLNFFWYWFN